MIGQTHPDAESSAAPVPSGDRNLAEDLAILAASAAHDADEPLTRDRPESQFLPGVPLS